MVYLFRACIWSRKINLPLIKATRILYSVRVLRVFVLASTSAIHSWILF
jgi:hypothetical protein